MASCTSAPRLTLPQRSFEFAATALRLTPLLQGTGSGGEHIGRQLLRAAASVGANIEEGQVALSRRDMAAKYAIALREAREALYWLRLLIRSQVLIAQTTPMAQEANELVAMLTVAVRKLREDGAQTKAEGKGQKSDVGQ